MKERSVVHATFVIEKKYPAASERVFAAFADPKKKQRWYGEGEESTLERFEMDFRVGGKDRTVRRAKNGWRFVAESVYLDILPNRHIVFAYTMSVGEKRISSSQATVECLPDAEGTKLIFTEQGAYLEGRTVRRCASRAGGCCWDNWRTSWPSRERENHTCLAREYTSTAFSTR